MQRRDLIAAYAILRDVPENEARQAVDAVTGILRLALERGNDVRIRRLGEFVQSKGGVRFYQGFRVEGKEESPCLKSS